jgi:hypothetical protein
MPASPYDLWIEQYSNYQNTMLILSGGQTTNLTGWSADMKVLLNGAVILTLSSLIGSPAPIVVNPGAGTIAFNIPASITSTLAPCVAHYDLLLTDSSGNKTRLLQGLFVVSAGVTPT